MGRRVSAGSAWRPGTDWKAQLRARGYRLTPQRQLVLEAVGEIGHATPDEIASAVRRTAAGVNISTVYRTLELLEELGLVRHSHLAHGSPTYSLATDDEHVHLVCRGCGSVGEASPGVVAEAVSRLQDDHDFAVDVSHLTLFGRCGGCAEQSDPPADLSTA